MKRVARPAPELARQLRDVWHIREEVDETFIIGINILCSVNNVFAGIAIHKLMNPERTFGSMKRHQQLQK